MNLELNSTPAPTPREGKVSVEGNTVETTADAAEFQRLLKPQGEGTTDGEGDPGNHFGAKGRLGTEYFAARHTGQGNVLGSERPEDGSIRRGSEGFQGTEEQPRQTPDDAISNAGTLAGMSSAFASGLPQALLHTIVPQGAKAEAPESLSIPQWAGEMVDKLLVRDSADGSGQEVRLIMRQSELAGAEIRFRQTAEGLELALISDSPAGVAWLRKAGGELEARLKARLGSDAVRVSVEESSASGEGPSTRTRENRR